MATIQIGNVTGAIYQAERPLHLNPDGSATASLTYKCTTSSAYAVIPAYLSGHPFISSLACYESDLDQEPGGIIRITSIYKGVIAADPESLAQHEFSRTTTEAPIETHPKFAGELSGDGIGGESSAPVSPAQLATIELALQNCQNPPSTITGAALTLYNKKRRGIESYLKPGGIYKKTYVSNSYPAASLMTRVGKISTPGEPAPTSPSGQNYLCIGISWAKQAGVVTIMEEYQLSGPGGWDPEIYDSAT
jgi:hypothetical protein